MNLVVLDSVDRTQGDLALGVLNNVRQAGGVIGVALLRAVLGEPVTSIGVHMVEYVAAGVLCLASGMTLTASKGWRSTKAISRHPRLFQSLRGGPVLPHQLTRR
jgi:hypothetical protein